MRYFIILLIGFSANAKELSVTDFLNQVQQNHTGYKASQSAQEGAKLRFGEAELLTLPQLSLTAQGGASEKPNANPAMGTKNVGQSLSVAISEQTSFGLAAKLKYDWLFQNTEGASSTFMPKPEYYTASPSIELSQSLWKNGFGSETRAQKELIKSNAKVSHYTENFKVQAYLMDASNAYLKLYFTRQTLKALQESLNTSSKLMQWAKNRTATNLGDRSDFLQTKAAHQLRELDLVKTQFEERSQSRYFNSLRGVDSYIVTEELATPQIPVFKSEEFNESKWRDDVKAAAEGLKLAKAKSQTEQEKNKPTLELFGSYALNSSLQPNPDDMTSQEAINTSFDPDRPAYAVGIRFTAPLAFGTSSDVRKGYEKEILAADLNLQRKYTEQARDYKDLQVKIDNALERLKLARILEGSQREKLDSERKRHNRGRTTLYQVLQYEQDFVSSQLNTIRTESECHMLMNELKLYKGGSI